MKKLLSFLLIVMIALSLASCTPNKKTIEEIKNDIQSYLNSETTLNIDVKDVTILKRQTNTNTKSDFVFIEVAGSNDDIECVLSYQMAYKLYDQGWILDSVSKYAGGVWNIKPLQGPKQELADEIMKKDIYKATFDKREDFLENGTSKLYYTKQVKAKYATYLNLYIVKFSFDPTSGLWERDDKLEIDMIDYKWNISGIWYPASSKHSDWYDGYVMTIEDIVDNKVHITVSKNGKCYFDDNVLFDDKTGAKFTVKTSNSSWDDMEMKISPNFVGDAGFFLSTRGARSFEKISD